jgi:hypothetical protein
MTRYDPAWLESKCSRAPIQLQLTKYIQADELTRPPGSGRTHSSLISKIERSVFAGDAKGGKMVVDSTAPKILIALWAMSGLSGIFMVSRFYCKSRYGRSFGYDDFIMAVAWVRRTFPAHQNPS